MRHGVRGVGFIGLLIMSVYIGFVDVVAEDTVSGEMVMSTSTESVIQISTSTPEVYQSIMINEVVVQPLEGEKEWIELHNASDAYVELAGLILRDEVGVIATVSSTIQPYGYEIIELSKSVLNNTGDGIFLYDNEHLIDAIIYGNAKSDVRDSEQAPGKGHSLVKTEQGDILITTQPTKGEKNIFINDAAIKEEEAHTTSSIPHLIIQKGSIIINEFVSDPSDEAEEFIELFNGGNESVDITGWYLEDSGETKTVLSGSITAKNFFVIEKPKGALNNSGDQITLFSPDGKEIDRIAYGTIDDGNIADNAPIAKDPLSVARKVDGGVTGNNQEDFSLTEHITKGGANIIFLPIHRSNMNEEGGEVTDKQVLIYEIFPNPKGVDTEKEFIEIKNVSSTSLDLTGWKIGDNSKTRYIVPSMTITPGSSYVFFRKETKISLNNSGSDSVRLFTASGALADSVIYEGAVGEDESFARQAEGGFLWTTNITPGEENIFVRRNSAPEISMMFPDTGTVGETMILDASDTTDQDQDVLMFSWFINNEKIGDGELAHYTFSEPGKYTVSVAVNDGVNDIVREQKKIMISVPDTSLLLSGAGQFAKTIRVTEIFPDPEGSDTEDEFVELYNEGEYEVDISGWYIDDAEGGSRAFRIVEGTVIGPHQYMIFERIVTRIALNNTEDRVRLLFPDKTLAEEIILTEVVEGAAYTKQESAWVWSGVSTPGEMNNHVALAAEKKSSKKITGKDGKIILKTSIEEVREYEPGDKVMIQGTVAVKPGVFSSTIFYIVNRAGIQITMPKKILPHLEVGDIVEITGVLSDIKGERRIQVKNKEDIRIIRPGTVPEIPREEIVVFGEDKIGSLGMIEGEVVEKKGTNIYIDDGTGEMAAVIPKGVKFKEPIKEGDIVRVVGIIRFKGEEPYIMPRMIDDVQKVGVVTTTTDVVLHEEKEKNNSIPYYAITASGVGILGLARYLRKKRSAVQ